MDQKIENLLSNMSMNTIPPISSRPIPLANGRELNGSSFAQAWLNSESQSKLTTLRSQMLVYLCQTSLHPNSHSILVESRRSVFRLLRFDPSTL